jgi:hypothetical protein
MPCSVERPNSRAGSNPTATVSGLCTNDTEKEISAVHSIVGGRSPVPPPYSQPRNQESSEMMLPGTYIPWVDPPSHPLLFGIF